MDRRRVNAWAWTAGLTTFVGLLVLHGRNNEYALWVDLMAAGASGLMAAWVVLHTWQLRQERKYGPQAEEDA